MLTLAGIEKSFGGRALLVEASLQVNRGDRIGLIGPNGAGKSTLFRILLGQEQPDGGQVVFQRGTTRGHLPQESAPVADETVLELALSGEPELLESWRVIRRGAEGGTPPDDRIDSGEALRRFDELDGHRTVARARQVLRGLSFRESDQDRLARTMSGGWVMRAHLARLLVLEPDLLLLDEPTNHLDLEALLWFQDYLKSYPGALLVISHDREFLNELVRSIVEIRQSRLYRYRGNYDDYLRQRDASEEQQRAAYKNQQREIARLQRFVDRFRAKNTKASQAQSKLKQIERMEKVEAPEGETATIDFRFPQPVRGGLKPIRLEGVRHAYGENVVYSHLDFEVERGQRIVLVGPNGAGKSTLLKLLAGVVPVQSGTRTLGHNVRAGYFSQYRIDQLDLSRTVLEEAADTPQRVTELFVRTVLGAFLFRDDDVYKKVSVLSGGEKSRLALVKLLLDPPNLLLLDEPTTHLDIPSTEALLAALGDYEGTVIFISHDVFFIRQLADRVVQVCDGRLIVYPGGYDYYCEKVSAQKASAARQVELQAAHRERTENRRSDDRREQKRIEAEQRQLRSRQRKEQKRKVEELETEIHTVERRQHELQHLMQDPATYSQSTSAVEVQREFADNQARLLHLLDLWEQTARALAELEDA